MKNGNHPLAGTYKGSRDSHIVLEMILILSKPNKKMLWLARIETHNQTF